MTTIEQVNRKVNDVIEWILNEHQLINKGVLDKLEDMLIGNLRYIKDRYGNTLKIEVID